MAWVYLFTAGLFEVAWAVALKRSEGFTKFWPSAAFVAAMAVSLILLGVALRSLPLGTAYAIWTGVGAVGTVILGITLFGESASAARLACVGLIVAGIIGLKLVSAE
ncbi:quaternary ammonium compound efflux SMR transporter SugE [Limnoglobus roseus]|uniref:Guanidinium exporter n=1 Tax=Limnoglobus roseus TaxID=2598579 RepID=A0A5C1AC63_9BACT|nr:quaternary ammonium compound efflux SMR transporter SugE [Limnoglobus roseus]QEL16969.1 QacE family quaternary ammonium compound efflux SMR transporter [Limnoglobus roseus]